MLAESIELCVWESFVLTHAPTDGYGMVARKALLADVASSHQHLAPGWLRLFDCERRIVGWIELGEGCDDLRYHPGKSQPLTCTVLFKD